MAMFVSYNQPIDSTAVATTDPSTTSILAELDSTNFGYPSTGLKQGTNGDRLYGLNIYVGASTGALWTIEHATSTNVASTAIASQISVRTGSNQTSQFVWAVKLGATDRVRVRVPSSFSGQANAHLQAQALA